MFLNRNNKIKEVLAPANNLRAAFESRSWFLNRYVLREAQNIKTRKKGATFLAALFATALLLGAGTTAHALSITYGPDCGSGNTTGQCTR